MATQKSYYKTIFTSKKPINTGWNIAIGEDTKVVVDPYSGKYYGEAPKEQFVKFYQEQIKAVKQNLDYYNSKQKIYYGPSQSTRGILSGQFSVKPAPSIASLGLAINQQNYTPGGFNGIADAGNLSRMINEKERQKLIGDFTKQLANAEAELQRYTGDGYVQKTKDEQFFKSYDMYKDTWDGYFEATYKNPRVAEEQKNKSSRDTQRATAEYQAQQDRNALAAAAGGNEARRTSKTTGVSASTINPFGSLEAGLGV